MGNDSDHDPTDLFRLEELPANRVLIVDDHTGVNPGKKSFRNLLGVIDIVGKRGNREKAIELSESLQKDIILLDKAIVGSGRLSVHPSLSNPVWWECFSTRGKLSKKGRWLWGNLSKEYLSVV